ncbi:SH3 domain-containing protein [Streptomyces paludis]|uniref:SH3 domain-containing protein n=1 Tax=Streptomyces paludis TaxID=2282738 RepID=A0A345HU88_9ACTN|nr:SH3 domain-containing protein [Streptomyces paludis]AXG80262.1 SH3 domain-containing protein [Streptomyces paludis]
MRVRSLGRTVTTLTVTTLAAAALALTTVAPTAAATPADSATSADHTASGHAASADDTVGVQASPGEFRGEVIARTGLLLHDKPYRSARTVGSVAYGEIVQIFCRVQTDYVDGNPNWYLLADGRWAWASAHYIRNIGPVPHTC